MNQDRDPVTVHRPVLQELPRFGLSDFVLRLRNLRSQRNDMLSGLARAHEKFGNAVMIHMPGVKMVNLFGPDANRMVLLDQDRVFSARQPWMMIMGKIFPNGLLLLDGDKHKLDRKVLHTAFTRPALRGYTDHMNEIVTDELATWVHQADRFEAFPRVKELTLTMAARVFFGIELGSEIRKLNHAMEAMVAASMSRVRLDLPGLEFRRGLEARRVISEFIGGMISDRRDGKGTDIFSRLCRTVSDEGERFSDRQIVDHMSFLMMAAHDTTTSSLTSILYELGRHPAWQERARSESIDFGDTPPRFDELDQFPAAGLVMKEALRLFPPLPVIPRIAERDFEFEGYRVPAGAMVVISALLTHRLPQWWDDPEVFDPERFGEARAEDQRHSHNYIPFGGGPHMCLGLRFAEAQVKIVIHHLLRRFRWSLREGYTMPVQQAPISKPRDGLPLILEPIA